MPWLETAPMEQRTQFIEDHSGDRYTNGGERTAVKLR